jgi:enoyl-CoA hydratase
MTLDPDSYQFLDIAIEDGVALIRLNRPEKLNAVRAEDHIELGRVLRDLAKADDVRCAVVTGAGRAFSVGGDYSLVEETTSDPLARLRILEEARELVYAHLELEKPIIAAINGIAAGAGAAFALLCDIIIVDRSASIADGHIRGALAAGDGGVIAWPLSAGMLKAKRYLLTGDFISAEEAERIGLVTEVVEDGVCLDTAMALAKRLASGPQVAIRYTKRALNQLMRDVGIKSFDLSLAYEMLSKDTGETAAILKQWQAGNTG